VANTSDTGLRQIRIGIKSSHTHQPVVCKGAEKAFAWAAKGIGAARPIRHKPIHEHKTLPGSFGPEGFETTSGSIP
jgi:hypothetical protein